MLMAMHGSHGEAKRRVGRGCNGHTLGVKKKEARYKIGLRKARRRERKQGKVLCIAKIEL